jgi:hypothetical protein
VVVVVRHVAGYSLGSVVYRSSGGGGARGRGHGPSVSAFVLPHSRNGGPKRWFWVLEMGCGHARSRRPARRVAKKKGDEGGLRLDEKGAEGAGRGLIGALGAWLCRRVFVEQ